jgi:hypothetical protein
MAHAADTARIIAENLSELLNAAHYLVLDPRILSTEHARKTLSSTVQFLDAVASVAPDRFQGPLNFPSIVAAATKLKDSLVSEDGAQIRAACCDLLEQVGMPGRPR